MTGLRISYASREAAEYAVNNWHYSQSVPPGKLLILGVWENEQFIGVVLFGRGANGGMLRPFDLQQTQGCELVRVALREHSAPVSQIVAEALRLLKRDSPSLRICVSYADPVQNHHGGIYQAGNWIYLGMTGSEREWVVNGVQLHGRVISTRRKTAEGTTSAQRNGESRKDWLRRVFDPHAYRVTVPPKHRYAMPLDKQMRRRLLKSAIEYPKPCGSGLDGEMPGYRPEGVGSTPASRSHE